MILFCGSANAGMGEFAIRPTPDAAVIAPKCLREILLFDDKLQFLSKFRTGGLGTRVQGEKTILIEKLLSNQILPNPLAVGKRIR